MTKSNQTFHNNHIHNDTHVLQVVSGDLWAGAEVMLYTLAKALHTNKHATVSVVILNSGMLEQKLRQFGIPVFLIDESHFNAIQVFQQLNRIIDELRPDVIHTHRLKENILGSVAAWRNHKTPSIRTLHGASEHTPRALQIAKRLILSLDYLTGRYYQNHIVAVSEAMQIQLKKSFSGDKVKCIENGIDLKSLSPDGFQARKTNPDSIHIGIVGRLMPVKRVDLFIDCAVLLKQQHPEHTIHFHIYGDGPLLSQLQQQVTANHAEDFIHFEGHCASIAERIKQLDALLMTSDHEGLPMVLLEAMALATPIISHAVGGIPHLLADGQCGILVKQHSAQAFSNAIVQLLDKIDNNPSTKRAYQRIEALYSAEKMAESYLGIYNHIKR